MSFCQLAYLKILDTDLIENFVTSDSEAGWYILNYIPHYEQ